MNICYVPDAGNEDNSKPKDKLPKVCQTILKRERVVCRVENNNQITASCKVAAAAAAKSLQ